MTITEIQAALDALNARSREVMPRGGWPVLSVFCTEHGNDGRGGNVYLTLYLYGAGSIEASGTIHELPTLFQIVRDRLDERDPKLMDATLGIAPPVDPRDPDPSRPGVFADHNCSVCDDGRRPCVRNNPRDCDTLFARND